MEKGGSAMSDSRKDAELAEEMAKAEKKKLAELKKSKSAGDAGPENVLVGSDRPVDRRAAGDCLFFDNHWGEWGVYGQPRIYDCYFCSYYREDGGESRCCHPY